MVAFILPLSSCAWHCCLIQCHRCPSPLLRCPQRNRGNAHHCSGVVALIATALLPASQTGICLDTYEALLLCSSSLPVALLPYPVLFHGNLAFDGSAYIALAAIANVALAALPVIHLRHCKHHAVTVARIAPALLLSSHGCLCPQRAGIVTLVAPTLPPASQTGVCPVMTQSQHVGISGVVAMLLVVAGGCVAVPDVVPRQLGL
jgi:hypothetical protein